MSGIPTFGNTIRAGRLGFRWSPKHNAMIRIQNDKPGQWIITMCPADQLPSKASKQKHVCWWDDPTVLDTAPAILQRSNPIRPISFLVGDDGAELAESTKPPSASTGLSDISTEEETGTSSGDGSDESASGGPTKEDLGG